MVKYSIMPLKIFMYEGAHCVIVYIRSYLASQKAKQEVKIKYL